MIIRTATENDLDTILALGKQYGHQMLYQQSPELMKRYLNRIIVAEDNPTHPNIILGQPVIMRIVNKLEVVGFYHYIVSGDPGFEEMLRCYRQMPESIITEARDFGKFKPHYMKTQLCIVMQGGCHRDAFKELIGYLQSQYVELWCYNSITDQSKPSSKIEGYCQLGFTYDPEDKSTFFNVHKGGYSTYQLGRWTK